MADGLMGLFSTPEDVLKAQRAVEQQQFNDAFTSGDAFLRGQALGGRIGQGIGGMLGAQNPEVAKAETIQNLLKGGSGDMRDPENLTNLAEAFNAMGLQAEALKLLTARDERIREIMEAPDEKEERSTVMVPKIYKGEIVKDDEGNPVVEPKTIYRKRKFNKDTMKWEYETREATADDNTAVFHDSESLKRYLEERRNATL